MEELLNSLYIRERKKISWSKYDLGKIDFYLDDKEIEMNNAIIDMKALKAIVAKCKDLGWLEDNEGVDRSEN